MFLRSRFEGRPAVAVRTPSSLSAPQLLSDVALDYFGFAIQSLRGLTLATDFAEQQNFHLKNSAFVGTCSMSPMRTSREAWQAGPLDLDLPRSQAFAGRDRVLKNLAAKGHLSILTES